MYKFGKPAKDWIEHHNEFFDEDERLKKRTDYLDSIYREQPRRTECKICKTPLGDADFVRNEIGYVFCDKCDHLNGVHQDTEAFCNSLYIDDDGEEYGDCYRPESKERFNKRIDDIYYPKAEFLGEALRELGDTPEDLSYCDWGTGTGFFVGALRKAGFTKSEGYEVGKAQVEYGNVMLDDTEALKVVPMDGTGLIESIDTNVFSVLSVLEHVQEPMDFLKAVSRNPNIKYIFLSVPIFSPTTYIEMAFPTVKTRLLAHAHTHLYTESSIKYFADEIGFKVASQWWFGSDMLDLYRSLYISAKQQGSSERFLGRIKDFFVDAIDDLQVCLDKRKSASEVHMLLARS